MFQPVPAMTTLEGPPPPDDMPASGPVSGEGRVAGHLLTFRPESLPPAPVRFVTRAARSLQTVVTTILRSYPEVLFLDGVGAGLVVLIATFLNPTVGAAGLIAVLAAYLFASVIGMERTFLASGYYTYNSLLVGLGLGSILAFSWPSLFFVAAGGVLAFVTSMVVAGFLRSHFNLPPLSLPFVICLVVAEIAALRYSNLLLSVGSVSLVDGVDLGLPLWLASFFCSLGAVLFSANVVVGLAFATLILAKSRILFMLGFGGFYLGVGVRGLLVGSYEYVLTDVTNFNFILVAMAVGGVFLTPSLASYCVAAVAVIASTVVLDAATVIYSTYVIPVYTLPFNVVSLAFVYALWMASYTHIPTCVGKTPEETLEIAMSTRWRFPVHRRTLGVPFFGTWTVWQGFDDVWTHQGAWRHAYDFLITDSDGRTCQRDGSSLEDFHCFRKPIVSPVSGRVVRVVSELPDNPIGRSDKANNWGNLVILYDLRGFYVELSHFAQDSIRVKEGDWVEVGTLLGLCGNSGYSPQPHLHVQVQATAQIGSATLPFSFTSYISGTAGQRTCTAYGLPAKDSSIEPAVTDVTLDRATDFLLQDQFTYEVQTPGQPTERVELTVKMAPDGTFYFETPDASRLYFGKYDRCYFAYRVEGRNRLLQALCGTLPQMPIVGERPMAWSDRLPATTLCRGWRRMAAQLVAAVAPRLALAKVQLQFEDRHTVTSTASWSLLGVVHRGRVTFDEQKSFASISFGNTTMRRLDHEMA